MTSFFVRSELGFMGAAFQQLNLWELLGIRTLANTPLKLAHWVHKAWCSIYSLFRTHMQQNIIGFAPLMNRYYILSVVTPYLLN